MRLDEHEHVVIRTRAHPRQLLGAAAVLVATAAALAFVVGWLERPDLAAPLAQYAMPLRTVAMVLAAAVVLAGTVRPLWRWATRTVVLTSDRLVQSGPLGGGERSMPLLTIAAVEHRRRGSGAGDLHVTFQDAFQQVYWRLTNVPEIERFEAAMADETVSARRRRERAWAAAPRHAAGTHPGRWGR